MNETTSGLDFWLALPRIENHGLTLPSGFVVVESASPGRAGTIVGTTSDHFLAVNYLADMNGGRWGGTGYSEYIVRNGVWGIITGEGDDPAEITAWEASRKAATR
jgi:hypothetical protein